MKLKGQIRKCLSTIYFKWPKDRLQYVTNNKLPKFTPKGWLAGFYQHNHCPVPMKTKPQEERILFSWEPWILRLSLFLFEGSSGSVLNLQLPINSLCNPWKRQCPKLGQTATVSPAKVLLPTGAGTFTRSYSPFNHQMLLLAWPPPVPATSWRWPFSCSFKPGTASFSQWQPASCQCYSTEPWDNYM